MTSPTAEDLARFKLCFQDGTKYSKEYWALDAKLRVLFECPMKHEFDLIVDVLDEMQREGASPAKLSRMCHTARIRAYLRKLNAGDLELELPSVMEEAQRNDADLREILWTSLDFADEALYNILRRLAEDFKLHLGMLFSGPSGEMSEVEKFVARKLAEGLPEPRKANKHEIDDGPPS